MDREQIIRMAREAELIMETDCTTPWMEDHDLTPYLERFAALVAAHEREACAKVCEILEAEDDSFYAEFSGAIDCAAAIRARGNSETHR